MIKISVNSLGVAIKVLRYVSNLTLPMKDSYKVLRMIKHFEELYDTLKQTYAKLFEKYGEREENGSYKMTDDGSIIIKALCKDECNKLMTNLQETFISLPDDKLPISLLEGMEITPNELMQVMLIFEE